MIVGVAVVEIHVHDSQSLKAKRGVVRSLMGRLRNKFNVSVSEVGGQGTWQRATIGLSMTGSDEITLRRALQKAVDFVEEMNLAEVIDRDTEIIRMPLASGLSGEPGLPGDDGDDLPWDRDLGEESAGDDPTEEAEE